MKMLKLAIAAIFLFGTANAGLPPTASKGSGEANYSTTFNFAFPNFTVTHTGTEVSLGVLSVAGGGTNSTTSLNNNRLMISSGGSIVEHSALTQGQVVYPDSNGLPVGSSNFFWDNTNGRLGIGTSSPSVALEVAGVVRSNTSLVLVFLL